MGMLLESVFSSLLSRAGSGLAINLPSTTFYDDIAAYVVVILALFYPTTMTFLCAYAALLARILISRIVHLIITWVVHGF